MISVSNLELRVGARLLMDEVSFRIDAGDKVGLVGRNGAGKTTMTRILAGAGQPTDGTVERRGEIGYLPQDPKVENMDQLARERILSARNLDQVTTKLREAEKGMASEDGAVQEKAMKRYARLEDEFQAGGGTPPRPKQQPSAPTSTSLNASSPSRCTRSPAVSATRRARPHPVLPSRDAAAR